MPLGAALGVSATSCACRRSRSSALRPSQLFLVEKRRARGIKYDSEEDLADSAKMPCDFDYSSDEEEGKKKGEKES